MVINFFFTKKFKVENISDDVILKMLDNLDNRILKIGGSSRSNFAIIRRLSDNRTEKFRMYGI